MTYITQPTLTLIARFMDSDSAEAASSTIEVMLRAALSEMDALFTEKGGVVDSSDINRIYTKYGMRNDIGWSHTHPIAVNGSDITWQIPEGVNLEDARLLLLSLGARAISLQPDEYDENYLSSLHPMAFSNFAEDLFLNDCDEEAPFIFGLKKVFH